MQLSKNKVSMGLACIASCAIGVGLSLLPDNTQAVLASADTGATTYSSDTLLMHDEVGYSDDGITFKITVPETYMESLKAGMQRRSGYNTAEGYSWWQIYETAILITRAEKSDGYMNATEGYPVAHSGFSYSYEEFSSSGGLVGGFPHRYSGDVPKNTDLFDFQVESYFFAYTSDYLSTGIEMPYFDENNTAYFTIPHAKDDKDYYYYAQVVEVQEWHMDGFFWSYLEYGANLVKNIPFEHGDMYYGDWSLTFDGVRKRLENEDIELTEDERRKLQERIGVPTYGEQIETTVHYKTLADKNDPTSIVDKSQTIFLPAEYAQRKSGALEQFALKGQQDGTWGDGSSYFNVNYVGSYIEDGVSYETGNKIILQVDPYESYHYVYDYETNTASITVNYFDFQYKETALKVTNNDHNDEQNLTMYVFTNDVTVSGDIYTITWNYAKVSTYMKNSANWLCEITDDNITANNSEYWTVTKNGNEVSVTFDVKNQNQLVALDISANAEIVEDYECAVWLCYTRVIGWDSTAKKMNTEKVNVPLTVMWSDFGKYTRLDNLQVVAPELYDEIVNAGKVDDVVFADPARIDVERSAGTDTYWISIGYEHPKYFVLENSLNGEVSFVPAESTALEFSLGDLIDATKTPAGYRVKDVAFEEEFIKVEKDAERPDDYKKTKITVKKVSDSQFYLASIEYTDKFNFVVEYFTNYVSVYGKETPFAVKTRAEKEVALSEYNGDPFNMTFEDVCRIVGKESMEDFVICGLVRPDEQMTLSFNGTDTYTITLNYGVASQRVINYEGQATEIQVPLRRYVDWLNDMGNDDWTILMLNNEKNKYFRFSNDIAREEIYGFFSIAVFDEQYKDGLNNWISSVSAGGCMVMWESEEAQGDEIYKWMKTNDASFLSKVCMLVCEVFNDSNHIYNYQFFYLDGSVDQSFISNGNADHAYDDDSALENLGQDVWDGITGSINQFLKSGEEIFVVLRIVAGVALAGGAVFLVIWGLSKLGIIKSKTVMVEQKPKTGRKNERKKK